MVLDFEPGNKAFSIVDPQTKKPVRFTFDHVLPPTATQEEAFKCTAEPLLVDVFGGYNTTIFTYGQTGSGKTFSMMGNMHDKEQKGIIPRLVEGIFHYIEAADSAIEFTVKVSYVEIYNEKIRDLMCIDKDNLKIRESANGVWIEDVTQVYVRNCDDVYEVLSDGAKNRAVSATKMNAESSRSHSVFIVTIGQKDGSTGSVKGAKLTLVDLAGSEKVGKTGADGQTLKEAQHINKSLSALGNVINALTTQPVAKPGQKKPAPVHIPYRDSKLTYLLSDSLGGNSKTCLIITGSPSAFNAEETLSTMRFGNRAKNIKNKPKVNQEKTAAEYQRLLNAANAKVALLQDSQKLLETEVGMLRSAMCLIDPAYRGLVGGRVLVDVITSITVRASVARAAKAQQGHQGWMQWYKEEDVSANAGLTIDDIMKQMNGDGENEGEAESDGPASPKDDSDVVTPAATPKAPEDDDIEEKKLASVAEEESPFAVNSDDEDSDKHVSFDPAAGDAADDDESGTGKREDRRVSSMTFALQSRELLEAQQQLEEEIESLRGKAEEREAEHLRELQALHDKISTLQKECEEREAEVHQARQHAEEQMHAVEESWSSRTALEQHQHASALAELKAECEALQKEKLELEVSRAASRRQAKMQLDELAELKTKYQQLSDVHAQRELVLAGIRSKHGDSILEDLSGSEVRVGVDILAETQAELSALKVEDEKKALALSAARGQAHALTTAYQRKCQQFNRAQLTLSACKVHMDMLEKALFAEQQRSKAAEVSYAQLLEHSESKLAAAEKMVQGLYESGLYWKGMGMKYGQGGRVVVPIIGGGAGNANNNMKVGVMSPAVVQGRGRAVSVTKNAGGGKRGQSSMDAFF